MGSDRTYAIGDIHGHLDKLRAVHHWIEVDCEGFTGDVKIAHVGDLVDRGPDSAGVVDWLLTGVNTGKPWVVLKGNHDRMLSWFLETPLRHDHRLRPDLEWLNPRLGGRTTLASYGVDTDETQEVAEIHAAARSAVPIAHQEFLAGLPCIYQADGVAFVHAGIRPGIAIDEQVEDDLIWIRQPFQDETRDHGVLIIHGHTPVKAVTHYGNRINIDTGVAFGGPLSVIVAEGRDIWQIGPDGRTPLLPVDPLGFSRKR